MAVGGWMDGSRSLQLASAQIDTQVYGWLFYDFSLFFFFCRTWVGIEVCKKNGSVCFVSIFGMSWW
jgi:hypothetical protein